MSCYRTQLLDPNGKVTCERGLQYDVYRTGVNPKGRGILFLSMDCILHGYGTNLEPILQLSLRESPEIQACAKRLWIDAEQLKNHLRCVALSADNSRYLFTVVDEAWCNTRVRNWNVRNRSV